MVRRREGTELRLRSLLEPEETASPGARAEAPCSKRDPVESEVAERVEVVDPPPYRLERAARPTRTAGTSI